MALEAGAKVGGSFAELVAETFAEVGGGGEACSVAYFGNGLLGGGEEMACAAQTVFAKQFHGRSVGERLDFAVEL